MAILLAYQADVLKELDEGGGVTPEAVKELCMATDLALRATKHTARVVECSMAGLVAAECHLWLNLPEICDKEKVFLLDVLVSQKKKGRVYSVRLSTLWLTSSEQPSQIKQVCPLNFTTPLPLSHFVQEWKRLPGVSPWVLRTIQNTSVLPQPPLFQRGPP